MTTKAKYKMDMRNESQTGKKGDRIVSYIEIVFGAPSKDCRGFGICKTKTLSNDQFEAQRNQQKSRRAVAVLLLKGAKDLRLCFLKSSMTIDTVNTFFKQDNFRVEETNSLSTKNDTADHHIKINAGFHTVFETQDYLEIKLRS